MFMAFLLVSSWLPAQAQKEPQIHQNQRLPGRTGMARKNSNRERSSEGGGGGKRTLGALGLLHVALAGHPGLLPVAAAHRGWIRRWR